MVKTQFVFAVLWTIGILALYHSSYLEASHDFRSILQEIEGELKNL